MITSYFGVVIVVSSKPVPQDNISDLPYLIGLGLMASGLKVEHLDDGHHRIPEMAATYALDETQVREQNTKIRELDIRVRGSP